MKKTKKPGWYNKKAALQLFCLLLSLFYNPPLPGQSSATVLDGQYIFLLQRMEIENLIEHRLRKIIDGHIPPTQYFLYAVIQIDKDQYLDSIKKAGKKRYILPVSQTKLTPEKLLQLKSSEMPIGSLLGLISEIKINLVLDEEVSAAQREALAAAISDVLKLSGDNLRVKNFKISSRQMPLQKKAEAEPKEEKPEPKDEKATKDEKAPKPESLKDFPIEAKSGEMGEGKKSLLEKIQNMEETINSEFEKMIKREKDKETGVKDLNYNYNYNLLYSLQFPITALVFGLILFFIAHKFLKFKYAELEFQKPIDPADLVPASNEPMVNRQDEDQDNKKEGDPNDPDNVDTEVDEDGNSRPLGTESPIEVISISRDDPAFIDNFLGTLEKTSRYALSTCVEDMLNQENGAENLMGMLRLLGVNRHKLVNQLSEKVAARVIDKMRHGLSESNFDYDKTIQSMQDFIVRYELEERAAKAYGKDEDLLFLYELDDGTIVQYLAKCEPIDGAVLLSLFSAKRAQELLNRLPQNLRKNIYNGFSQVHTFTPKVVAGILQKLRQTFEASGVSVVDGRDFILDMLGNMDDNEAKEFISSIDNQELVADVSKNFMTISALLRLNDAGIKALFSEFAPKAVAHFCYLAGEKISQIVMGVQNTRNGAIIKDTLNSLRSATKGRGAIRTRAEEAKKEILDRLREMVQTKEVTLAENEIRDDSFYSDAGSADSGSGNVSEENTVNTDSGESGEIAA